MQRNSKPDRNLTGSPPEHVAASPYLSLQTKSARTLAKTQPAPSYSTRCLILGSLELFDILPVTPSLFPSNQNSSMTLSTSMTSPVKRGSSSETLGRNSNTVRTTEPASITHYLRSTTDKDMSPQRFRPRRVGTFEKFSFQSEEQKRARKG